MRLSPSIFADGRVVMSETIAIDTTRRALGVAVTVAFACAVLVSAVAVNLRPMQKANVEAERIAQLELVLGALSDIGRTLSVEGLDARIVELDSGKYDDSIDVSAFDAARAAGKPATSAAIPADLGHPAKGQERERVGQGL